MWREQRQKAERKSWCGDWTEVERIRVETEYRDAPLWDRETGRQGADFSFMMIVHAYETEERGFGEGAAPCKSKLTWKWRLCRDEK